MPSCQSPSRRLLLRRPTAALAAVALAACASGCLSHEYRVSHDELVRIAELPPGLRGERIRVVQELGERRGQAIETAPPPIDMPVPADDGADVIVDVDVNVPVGHGGGAAYRPGLHPARAGGGRIVSAHPAGPGRVASTSGGGRAGGGGGSSSSGHLSSGGGGGNGDALVVLAVVAVAVAALAAVGLAVTEGLRYDGEIAAAPGQVLYLDAAEAPRAVPLAELTPADAAAARGALVLDDEGWGLQRHGRAPLDRRGFAFKVDLGGWATLLDHYDVAGFASHIQVGHFPFQGFGLLASWAITAASDSRGNLFARHNLALEAQAFPLHVGPLALGLFAHGGPTLATNGNGGTDSGFAAGGGALLELALTTRLALTFRADWTSTRVTSERWSPSTMLSGGLAIY